MILRIGSKGDAVGAWQGLLIQAGYNLPEWGIDNDFGNETMNATRRFQSDIGIQADGEVGQQTMAAMTRLVKKQPIDPTTLPPPGPIKPGESPIDIFKKVVPVIVTETGEIEPPLKDLRKAGLPIPTMLIGGVVAFLIWKVMVRRKKKKVRL